MYILMCAYTERGVGVYGADGNMSGQIAQETSWPSA